MGVIDEKKSSTNNKQVAAIRVYLLEFLLVDTKGYCHYKKNDRFLTVFFRRFLEPFRIKILQTVYCWLDSSSGYGRFGSNREFGLWTIWSKPSIINSGRFGPNHLEFRTVWPKPSITQILNPYFYTVLNRLDFVPNGFLQFLDGLKPSRNLEFFVVCVS
jgi:hypothetical protein